MSLGDYLVGLAFFTVVWGSVIAAAVLLVWRRLPELRGAARAVAVGLLATAGIVGVHLLPGLVGVLSRWTAAACALALLVAATRLRPRRAQPDPAPPPAAESGPFSWACALVGAAAVALWFVANLADQIAEPALDIDTLTFHLPNIAKWIQTGTFWRVDQFVPLLYNGNYPHNGDVVFLGAVLPWENDAFVKPLNLPFVALAALATYATALELRAPRATAVLSAALLCSLPVLVFAAEDGAKTDMILLATFAGGVFFLVRHVRTGRTADLLLGGLGLGLAFGAKWYAVSTVPVLVAVWAIGTLAARRDVRAVARPMLVVAGVVAAAGGFWLVRNLVESGNPAPPLDLPPLWDFPRDYVQDCGGFTIADYVGDWGIFDQYILPAWRDTLSAPGIALLAGVLVGGALAFVRRRSDGGVPLVLAIGALALAVVYSFTPYSAFGLEDEPILVGANARYLFPAAVVAAPVLAWTIGRLGRLRLAAELVALVALAEGVRKGFSVPRSAVAEVAVVLVAAGAVALALGRLRDRVPRAALPAAAAVAVLLLVAGGHRLQEKFNDGRYEGGEPSIDWILANAPEDSRIGLSGLWGTDGLPPVLPALGPRMRNEVEYAGQTIDGQLREPGTRAEWLARIRERRYDYLLVGSGGYLSECPVPGSETDERAWAEEQGWERLAESPRLALYKVAPSGG